MALNDELDAVNRRLQEKNDELEAANNDLANFLAGTGIATVFLDRGLGVRRFTPHAASLLNLAEADVGRPLADVVRTVADETLVSDAALVLQDLRPRAAELRSEDGRWYARRALPYRTRDERIEGVVITYVEVTDIKNAEAEATRFGSFPERNPNPVVEAGTDGRVSYQNPAARALFPDLGQRGLAHPWLAGLPSAAEALRGPDVNQVVREVCVGATAYEQAIFHDPNTGRLRIYGRDVTERRRAAEALTRSNAELERRIQERTAELQRATEAAGTERQRFYDVLEMLPAYVILLDRDYRVRFANRFFRERFGESGGRRCYEYLFDRAEPCEVCETYTVLTSSAAHRWEWTGPDRRIYDIHDYPFTDADGSQLIMEVGVDITERKQAESSLRNANETLELRVAERTAELERRGAVLNGINAILRTAFTCESEEQLGRACLAVAEEVTRSAFGFVGEIGPDGLLHDIAISDPGWEQCRMPDPRGHRAPPRDFLLRGVYGRVLLDGKAFVTNDPASHPDSVGTPPGHPRLTSFLGAPLIRDGRTVGMVALANREGGYGPEELESLQGLASAIVEALHRHRTERALRESLGRFELLARTAAELLRSPAPQELVASLCRKVMEHIDCQACINYLVDETGNRLHLNAHAGISPEDAGRIEWLDYGDAVCGCVARDGRRIVAEHVPGSTEARTALVRSLGIKAYCCNPLLGTGGAVIGTLSFGTRSRETFSDDDLSLMQAVTDLVAVALSRMQTTEALRRTAEELGRSNRELAQFAYVASHDLQEPLRMVSGFVSLLQTRYADRFDEKGREFIGQALEGATRMRRLIDDLLDYGRVDRRERPPGPVAVRDALDDALANLAAGIAETGADVVAGGLPTVVGDRARLAGVLQNLIANALTYRRAGVAPRIRVEARRRRDCWVFSVADNGIGIPRDQFERIFLIFQRLHSRDAYPGTGLGLAIVKKIVEADGGRVWVESRVGEGTTFHFSLPAVDRSVPPPA